MKVLVLGAYGLIGGAVTKQLLLRGDAVVGLARSRGRGLRRFPAARWIGADLADLSNPADWAVHLEGVDAVVNASGALQNAPGVDLGAVQRDAIVALIEACAHAGVTKFVQISAPGAVASADTDFLETKARADGALRESGLDWVILKPGLVLSQDTHGGTTMLRMAAGFPLVQPLLLADARVQTVDVADVALAVQQALEDQRLARQSFDLVETESHSMGEIILAFRAFMGFPAPLAVWVLPAFVAGWIGRLADAASWLGWPTALRSTGLKVLSSGVQGDPSPWTAAGGRPLRTLPETLLRITATTQDRIFARTRLVLPMALLVLAVFWMLSGGIGLLRIDAAVALISGAVGEGAARVFVVGGSLADLLIGVSLLIRPLSNWACVAAILLPLAYLLAGTWLTPGIWLDPLGPFVKILPAMVLAPVIMTLRTDR